MAVRDGDFYIQRSNQDFWLRENGAWVRKGNIRDEGSSGLVGIQPITAMGINISVQVDRIRFLGSVADDFGFSLAAVVSRIRLLSAPMSFGFSVSTAVTRTRQIAANLAMGFDSVAELEQQTVILIEAAMDFGFTQEATLLKQHLIAVSFALGFDQTHDETPERIKLITPDPFDMGFAEEAALSKIKAITASLALGFNEAAVVSRIRALAAADAMGFALSATVTHSTPQVGYLITCGVNLSTSAAYFQMYDGTYATVTAPSGMLTGTLGALAISHDKTKFAISNASDVKVFSLASGFATIHTLTGILTSNNVSLAWSPDDSKLLVINAGFIAVYSTSTWTTVTAPSVASSAAVAGDWSPDGSRIAISCSVTPFVRLFDTSTMGAVTNPSSQPASNPSNTSIRFSPDGRWLAYYGNATLFVYDRNNSYAKLTDPATMPTGGAGGRTMSIAWQADGLRFVVASNATPRLWSYTISGTTITKETSPATVPGSNSTGGLFVENDLHFAGQSNSAPKLLKYTVSGWVKDTDISTQPGTNDLLINMDKSF